MRGDLRVGDFSDLGGEAEELESWFVRRGWVRLVADLTRRVSGLALEGDSDGDWGRGGWFFWWKARVVWRWEIEPGVSLPEFEPVPVRNLEMPSAGMEGSFAKFGS